MQDKVSIVVPCFNLENYIEKCLHSLQSQTYSNLEIIVIDDGSTDNSWSIIRSIAKQDKRIITLRQNNNGAASCRNKALNILSGKYIIFVDGDDQLEFDTINNNLIHFQEYPSLDWVSFPIIRVDSCGNNVTKSKTYIGFQPKSEYFLTQTEFLTAYFNKKLSELACGTIYKSESILNIRFPEKEFYEDSFYFTDIIARTKNGYISTKGKYLYTVRTNSSQHTPPDYPRIISKYNCITDRLLKFKELNCTIHSKFIQEEDDFYYYLKTLEAKKILPANSFSANFKRSLNRTPNLRIISELKILVFNIIGYNRLKRILTCLKIN